MKKDWDSFGQFLYFLCILQNNQNKLKYYRKMEGNGIIQINSEKSWTIRYDALPKSMAQVQTNETLHFIY